MFVLSKVSWLIFLQFLTQEAQETQEAQTIAESGMFAAIAPVASFAFSL